MLTSDITAIIRNIREVYWYLKVRELLRRNGQIKHIAIPDLVVGLKIEDEGIQVVELQRDEVRSRIDLQFRKSGE